MQASWTVMDSTSKTGVVQAVAMPALMPTTFTLRNLLLGELFTTPVSAHRPIDPAKRAVTLDQADLLEKRFRGTMASGRKTASIEAKVPPPDGLRPAPRA